MTAREQNLLLANYMGYYIQNGATVSIMHGVIGRVCDLGKLGESEANTEMIKRFNYSDSWDLLISAYHKVTTLIYDHNKIDLEDCGEYLNEFHLRIMRNSPKEACEILVNLIKWYNDKN